MSPFRQTIIASAFPAGSLAVQLGGEVVPVQSWELTAVLWGIAGVLYAVGVMAMFYLHVRLFPGKRRNPSVLLLPVSIRPKRGMLPKPPFG